MDNNTTNRIVAIGVLGMQTCYLNISEEEAIARYIKDNDGENPIEMGYRIQTIELDARNEFEVYDIWSC